MEDEALIIAADNRGEEDGDRGDGAAYRRLPPACLFSTVD